MIDQNYLKFWFWQNLKLF